MIRHFTATVYIINEQKVLLGFHKKLKKWLPPGGHLETNESPPEAARREVREETGLEINFILQENVWLDHPNAKSFERPYLCVIEDFPLQGDLPPHQHMDFVYVARPASNLELCNSPEIEGMRWFTPEEVGSMKPDGEIFADTQQVVASIFNQADEQNDHRVTENREREMTYIKNE